MMMMMMTLLMMIINIIKLHKNTLLNKTEPKQNHSL